MDQENLIERIDEMLPSLWGDLELPEEIIGLAHRGAPLMVRNLEHEPSYWLVPLEAEGRLVGFLRLDAEGNLLAHGRFGQGGSLSDFPLATVMAKEAVWTEMRSVFADRFEDIGPPTLVHDGPIERIAWLSRATGRDGTPTLLFWTFGAAYSRPAGEAPALGMV